tara:strand:- start:56 stop:826 length:771 start_codon:yes stop_codon:yes gene_type:complete
MKQLEINLISTIKDREQHFVKTFPLMVTQYGTPYNIVLVNFHSNDNFEETLKKEAEFRKDTFSPYLKSIKHVKLLEDLKFNVRKARNLGASFCRGKESILCFSDIDVFLGMAYINYWSSKVKEGISFVTTRVPDCHAADPRRIRPEINYGNFLVHSNDFFSINGFNENKNYCGGEDDGVFHRLKLLGLRELNPHDGIEAQQYSIIHGNDLRVQERANPDEEFKEIFNISKHYVDNSNFLAKSYTEKIAKEETIYVI